METTSNSSFYEYAPGHTRASNRGRDDYFFVCTGPALYPHRTEIPRSNVEAIQAHRATCEKCSRIQREEQEQKQLRLEGPRRLEYILHVVGNAKLTIDYAESKKAELDQKEQQKGETVDYTEKEKLRLALYDSGVAESKIEKERIELYKLLNHENEVIRQGVKEAYLRYINGMKKLKREKDAVTPLSPSSLSSLKRRLLGLS